MDIKTIESDLKMKYLFFPESMVKRDRKIQNGSLNVDIKKEVTKNKNHEFTLKVLLRVKKNDLQINVTCVADFIYAGENEDSEEYLVNKNGVAIVFPFLRSQVTLLTSQPNMTPIVLPVINVNRIL